MMLKTILMFIMISFLTSCGFKLRGLQKLPSYMQEVVVVSNEVNHPFIAQLGNCLKSKGIVLHNQVNNLLNNNLPILEITTPEISEQVQGYNSIGQISYCKVYAKINYNLFDKEHKVIKQNTINRSITYQVDPSQLLSNNNEKNIILDELNMEIINELINQLSS